MKRVQTINDLDFTIEALTECVIEVSHRDQVGWFGVNLDDETEEVPFAWSIEEEAKTEDGVRGDNPAPSPEQALAELSAHLAELQEGHDAEVAKDPRNRLGALLSTMPTETNKGGWRRLRGRGADLAKRGTKAFQEKAGQAGGSIKEGTGSFLGKASEKASQGREKLQDGVAKANLPERRKSLMEAFSPSKQCEREGHLFDEVKLISTKGTISRLCRRCKNVIKVNLDEESIEEALVVEEPEPEEDAESAVSVSPNGTEAQAERPARVQVGIRRHVQEED